MIKKYTYLKGDKYNSLTLISNIDGTENFKSTGKTLFKCDCGNFHIATLNNVVREIVKFCSQCSSDKKSKNQKTHGHSVSRKDKDPLGYKCYYTYQAMKRRCYYTKDGHYDRYGARGIGVCNKWLESYENFLKDMGLPPSEKHSIERINNDGNYEPNNCKWILFEKQAKNKSNNRKITAFGKTMNLQDWAKETGISRKTIVDRIKRGYTPEQALSETERITAKLYINPKGEFKSLREAGEAYGLKITATYQRFNSNNYPDWIVKEIH